MKKYRERIVDALLRRKLAGTGAVLVEGAKWCGKTTTAEQIAQSVVYMAEPKKREADGGSVRHYRDKQGLECDSILHRRNGDYALVEIKLGGDRPIAEGVATLNRLSALIDSKKVKKPSFRMILTAVGDIAYSRKEDDIIVCPLTALKP